MILIGKNLFCQWRVMSPFAKFFCDVWATTRTSMTAWIVVNKHQRFSFLGFLSAFLSLFKSQSMPSEPQKLEQKKCWNKKMQCILAKAKHMMGCSEHLSLSNSMGAINGEWLLVCRVCTTMTFHFLWQKEFLGKIFKIVNKNAFQVCALASYVSEKAHQNFLPHVCLHLLANAKCSAAV